MVDRRAAFVLTVGALVLSACSMSVESGSDAGETPAGAGESRTADEPVEPAVATGAPSSIPAAEPEPAPQPEPGQPEPGATEPGATEPGEPEPDPTTTTENSTTTEPGPDIYDPACVRVIAEFDSLGLIAAEIDDDTVNVVSLRAENDLSSADINEGDLLDVCVDNGLDDITGAQRAGPNDEIVATAIKQNVEVQQRKLNRLFEGSGMSELLVDGISGPVTRQRLCAARVSLGLPINRDNMAPGSEEETVLLAAHELLTPFTSAVRSNRWILIDRTCQVMFIGEIHETTYIFPTSTGSEGFETRNQDRSRAFRFDPALDNGGWHDSTEFPSAADNPLNGNMYQPLYFDLGQAIHGANNVPTTPQSKGCARLRVSDQDTLVQWMGLAEARGPLWDPSDINVTVNVQGQYVAG